jgi:transposase
MEQMLGNPKSTPQDTPSRGATVAIFSVAIFSCELPDIPILPTDKPPVGIDVGLEAFLTTSGGDREPNPRHLKDALPELRKARAVSRKIKGSEDRRKAKRKRAKIHARVRDLRKEHHHQVAWKLVLDTGSSRPRA